MTEGECVGEINIIAGTRLKEYRVSVLNWWTDRGNTGVCFSAYSDMSEKYIENYHTYIKNK